MKQIERRWGYNHVQHVIVKLLCGVVHPPP